VTITNSKNEEVTTEYRYPYDYTSTASFITAMQDSKIYNKPIETVTYKVGTGSNAAIGGTINEYGTGDKNGLLIHQYSLDLNTPLNWSDGNFSNSLSGSTFAFNPNYSLKSTLDYANGNPVQFNKTNDLNTSYYWGYNNTQPVIKAENLDNSTLATYVTQSLPTGYSTLDALLNSIITFPNADWVTFNTNLRQKNSNVMFSTYTHKPLWGITSQTDPNGVTTYYEYDSSGRLRNIRDKDRNILKHYEYHYKN
jgi:YD repeat-containing protein